MFEGWGAAVAAAATVGGAVVAGSAASSAAKTQANAENNAAQVSQNQFDQTQANEKPFLDAADTSLSQLTAGTAPGGQFTGTFAGLGSTPAEIEANDPGYQFRMDQGMRGVDAGAAAAGGVLSGATLKAEQEFGQNYASGEYGNAFNRYTAQQTNAFNRLASIAGLGQTAANTDSTAGESNVNSQTAALTGAANANASGTIGTANAITNGGNTLSNLYQQQQLLAKLNGTTGGSTSGYTYGGSAASNTGDDIDAGGGWNPGG